MFDRIQRFFALLIMCRRAFGEPWGVAFRNAREFSKDEYEPGSTRRAELRDGAPFTVAKRRGKKP